MKIYKIIKKNEFLFLQLTLIILILLLPYYIFGWKMYVGGDDTKLFYSYPIDFLKNITFFSWVNASSIGINGPNQYIAPFLVVWYFLSVLVPDKVILNHLGFSLPLILGFIYFQKALRELLKNEDRYRLEVFAGSLFYVFSPIIILDQMFIFLISIWLLGLIPILIYYFIKYVRTGKFQYVYLASLWCLFLSFALYAAPWFLGFVLPIGLGLLIVSIFYPKKDIFTFFKFSIIFFGFMLFTQAFWLIGFISTYINIGQNSFASKFLSKTFVDTFSPTVNATATGTIMYPLLNLFHRQISVDFVWKLKDVFIAFYDKIYILNFTYLIILAFGILSYKKYLSKDNRKIFLILLLAFIFSLYFFTVNIGPLKDLFLLFRYIPGFTMFRNFYDKFAISYVIIYASIISTSLITISKKYPKKRKYVLSTFFIVVFINLLPIKETVNAALWTTNNVYKSMQMPDEYMNTMKFISQNISSSNNILSIPFGTSIYTVVKDKDTNSVYVGLSPVKIFSGVNDISGHLSFNFTDEADIVDGVIVNKQYDKFKKILFKHNVNFLLVTKNIPSEILNSSWLYTKEILDAENSDLTSSLVADKIYTSSHGNYELYTSREQNSLLVSKGLYFKKVNQVKYILYIKGIQGNQKVVFNDSYHPGWSLYLQKNPFLGFCKNGSYNKTTDTHECRITQKMFELNDLSYSFKKPIFDNRKPIVDANDNEWMINTNYIKANFDKQYYKINKDGSIDIEMIMYFKPQNYFYIGTIISVISFIGGIVVLVLQKKYEKK